MTWRDVSIVGPQNWVCGYCGKDVGGNVGYLKNNAEYDRVYICPHCDNPTAFIPDSFGSIGQYPGSMYGNEVRGLPETVSGLYDEVRKAYQAGAYTAAVLASRKLLMHIAVENGAPENESFLNYVDYLAASGYIPPNGKDWVDEIRKRSNEANHEIVMMSADDAEQLLDFTELLLKFVYEFPTRVKRK